jgi:hypothetical protein
MSDLLNTLARMDRTKVFLATLVVGLIGLFLPGLLGGVVLLVVIGAMVALMRLTWPHTPVGARVLRLLILGLLAVFALIKIF